MAVDGLSHQPFLLNISRMTPSKNVESLLRKMALWPERLLVLAGPAAGRNAELQAHCASLGLRNVRILTMVNDAQKAWLDEHCQVFLFPSLTEGFGLPPIEALYFGKPVLLTNRTCLPEVGGSAAHYWRKFNPAGMRRTTEAAIAGFGSQEAARPKAWAARYNWAHSTQAYIETYLHMLAGPA